MFNPASTVSTSTISASTLKTTTKRLSNSARRTVHGFAITMATFFAVSMFANQLHAATSLTLVADRAKIVRIAGNISSVIVGNPAFADVSVQKNFLIVHGRNFGQTNILILDEHGDTLADLNVTIVKGPDRNITVYRGGQKASYACAPKCESTLQVGDSKAYFDGVNQAISTKMDLARSAGKLTTK